MLRSSNDTTVLIESVLMALVVILPVYYLLKYVFYWIFGIWVSSIDVLLWKLRNLYYTNSSVNVHLKRFSIRINLFDPHHKLINFIVESLSIEYNDDTTNKISGKKNELKNEKEMLKEYLRPISIYPKSKLVRFFLRHLTRFIPSIDVKVKDVELTLKETPIKLRIKDMEFSTDYTYYKGHQILNFISDLKVTQIHFAFLKESTRISSILYIRVSGNIDLHEGYISNLATEFKSYSLTIPTFTLLKSMCFYKNKLKQKELNTKHERPSMKRSNASLFSEDVCFLSLIVNLVKENSFRFDDIIIEKIPLLSSYELSKICDDHFLSSMEDKLIFFKAQFKSISANYTVLRENNAGYDINFQKGDHPFQTVLTLMQTLISLDLTHSTEIETNCKPTSCYELINIPSVTVSVITNTLYQLVKRIETGAKFADALLNFNCSISNPIFDISTDHLGIILSRVYKIRYHNKIYKNNREGISEEGKGYSRIDYIYYLSSIWPLLNLKLLVERPSFILKTKSEKDDTISMVVLTTSLLNIGVLTTKNIDFEGNLIYYLRGNGTVSDLSLSFIKRLTNQKSLTPDSVVFELAKDQQIIKSSELGLKFDSKILPNTKMAVSFSYDSFSVDLSNLVILNGLCEILSDIDDNFAHLTYEQMIKLEELNLSKPKIKVSELLQTMVFRDLPPWFDSIKISGHHFRIVAGSRSVLIPAELVAQLEIPDIIDNVDGSLRKVSFFILDWKVSIDNNKTKPLTEASGSEEPTSKGSNTVSESDASSFEESEVEEYWRVTSNWGNAHSKVFTEDQSEEGEFNPYAMKLSTMSKIPNLELVVRSTIDTQTNETILKIEGDCEQVSIHYSLINHFLIISSFHLLNNTLFKPIIRKFRRIKECKEATNVGKGNEKDTCSKLKDILDVLYLRLNLHQFNVVTHFAQKFKTKMDGLRTTLLLEPGSPFKISNTLFRMLVESPTSPGFWTRFLSVNNSKIYVYIYKILQRQSLKIDEIGTLIEIANSGARVSIPHQFVVHNLFDQVSVAFKTLKQLHHSLKYNNNEIVIYPHEMKTPRIPKIKLRSKRFMFKMDDDPFESELNMIFQLGVLEQRRRMEKFANFKKKVAERLRDDKIEPHMYKKNINTDGLLEPDSTHKHSNTFSFSIKERNFTDPGSLKSATTMKPGNNEAMKNNVNRVDELDKKLFLYRKHISRSWIELVRDYKQKMDQKIDENSKYLWSLLKPSHYPPGFNHRVIGYPKCPPLMSMLMENVDLTIKSPNFPLEKVPDYIYDVGKGVPLDKRYTIMLPTHIDLRVKELRIHVRDYPLPLFYIPEIVAGQDKNTAALRVSGTFIVGEELSELESNIRKIYVPLVPLAKKAVNDKYFALDVPKTIASIKVFTTLQIDVNTKAPTRFTWGQSYQPAIQQIILNFDDFTKPQLDPSEKIGFWDKVRSILHARIQFKFCPESDLIVSLKGGRDPYSLLALSAGFLLIFKNNVCLDINKDDNPKEFLFVKSDEVGWSVANHLALPLLVWYRESNRSLFVPDSTDIYLDSVAGYYLEEQDGYSPTKADEIAKTFCEKNAIRLCGDVAFKVGLSFEREENGSRTHKFRPHYDVQLSNPAFVEDVDHYDAYEGFRSEFAHLSISLSSPDNTKLEKVDPTKRNKNQSYNVLHLSPRAFTQFFAWWKLFSGNMQLPVRRGVLFGPNKTSKKFSEVLSTLQFQFLISPLYLSHIYREDIEQHSCEERTECVGLKAKVDSFSVDLHQRKEAIVNKYSELDKTKSIQKMKMYLGEVDISDVDLRAVRGIFKGSENAVFDEEDGILEFGLHSNYSHKNIFKTYDNDTSWLDFEDFEEVALPSLKNHRSLIKISPVLFAPRFTYLRQLDHTIPQGVTPADNELAHDCVLGNNKFIETQKALLKARLEELEDQLASANSKRTVNNLKSGIRNVKALLEDLSSGRLDDDLADSDRERGFNNKFLIHNVQIKWNKDVRDIVFRYSHFLTMRRAVQHYLRHQSYSIVERIVEDQRRELETEESKLERFQTLKSEYLEEHHIRRDEFTYDDITCGERLEQFDEDLRSVINSSFRSSDDYLIKFISPQIQLCTDDVKSDSCVLVTSPEIEMKIVSIKQSSLLDENGNEILVDNEDAVLEKRYGSLFKDANIFVFYKKNVVANALSLYTEDCYGSTSNWPPWIGVELCYNGDSLIDNMILQKTSLVFRYNQIRELIRKSSFNDRKRVILDIPKVVTSCDSDQYYAFYDMVLNLLMYKEPSDTEFHDKLTSLILTTDFTDLYSVRDRIRNLQNTHSTLSTIGNSLAYKRCILSKEEHETLKLVTETRYNILSELFLLMRLVSKGSTVATVNKDEELEWTIRADEITVHMLDKSRNPFIDLVVKSGVFRRIEESSNSNTNIVQVNQLNAFNLEANAIFPEMITSYKHSNSLKDSGHVSSDDDDSSFVIEWAMDSPVGGIKVIRSVIVNMLPLKISMDQNTGEKLFNYLFPPSSDNGGGHSNILTLNNQVKHELDRNEERSFELKRLKEDPDSPMKPTRAKTFSKLVHNNHNNGSANSSEVSSLRSSDSGPRSVMSLSDLKSGTSSNGSAPSTTSSPTSLQMKSSNPKYVSQMISRASTFMSIVALTINSFVLNISFRGEGKYRLVNVSNLTLTMPKLQFHNKIWTIEDLFNHIKKLILKLVLNHSGVILANKLTHHKRKKAEIRTVKEETTTNSAL